MMGDRSGQVVPMGPMVGWASMLFPHGCGMPFLRLRDHDSARGHHGRPRNSHHG